MARTIEEETKRAKMAGENTKSKFTTAIRDVELNNIQSGDILIFSENYTVIDRPIRGTDDTAEVMYIKCKRGASEITVPFYPSLFWKTRQEADAATKKPKGKFLHANGEVVDFVQSKGDLNEAIIEIAKNHPNGVKVVFGEEKTLRFGEPEDGTGRLQNANIPTLTWA